MKALSLNGRCQMLRAQKIHKTYYLGRNELLVLRGVSLDVQQGQFLSITGSSGSGKSTLLHVMSGLDVPQRGQVYFQDRPIFEPEGQRTIAIGRGSVGQCSPTIQRRDHARAVSTKSSAPARTPASGDLRLIQNQRNHLRNHSFGFVFQFYYLLPEFDVLENVLLPHMVGQSMGGWLSNRGNTAKRAVSLLDRVGLGHRLHHRPNELSGGERQRAAIARALINEPDVLFADEPTGNLDGRTGRDIFNLIKELNQKGQTVILVTHDRELAQQADEVVQLVDGRLV